MVQGACLFFLLCLFYNSIISALHSVGTFRYALSLYHFFFSDKLNRHHNKAQHVTNNKRYIARQKARDGP